MKKPPRWTPQEDALFSVGTLTNAEISRLLPSRTRKAIDVRRCKLRARRLRPSHQRWRPWEDEILQQHHHDRNRIAEILPHRTRNAVRLRLGVLQLLPKRARPWKTTEIEEIRRNQGKSTNAELALRYGRTLGAIRMAVSSLGLRPKQLSDEGLPDLVVAIRSRGRQRGIGPTSIGLLVSCGKYVFSARNAKKYGLRAEAIVKAVELLDGDLVAVWDED